MQNYSEELIIQKYKKGVYFYCLPPGPPEWAPYLFKSIAIAEGLKALGIPFYSNINYWKLSPDKEEYLFNHNENIGPEDAAIVVLECAYTSFGYSIPTEIFKPGRKNKLVYIDNADGIFTDSLKPFSAAFDVIFKAQKNINFKYRANVVPDAYGLTQRVIDYTETDQTFEQKNKSILVNFRVIHTLRDRFKNECLPAMAQYLQEDHTSNDLAVFPEKPYDYLMWHQTGRRHHPAYYERLKDAKACACIGGNLMQRYPTDYFSRSLSAKIKRKFFKYTGIGGNNRIFQFDNWRFWETLAAGTATFHVDFEKYGAELPVMPQNFKHYIGIDFDNVKLSLERVFDEPGKLGDIANEGRKWVIENYAPKPTALRFLQTVDRF